MVTACCKRNNKNLVLVVVLCKVVKLLRTVSHAWLSTCTRRVVHRACASSGTSLSGLGYYGAARGYPSCFSLSRVSSRTPSKRTRRKSWHMWLRPQKGHT